jgi:spore maturation protein SpmB
MQELATTRYSSEFLALCGMAIGLVGIIGAIILAVAIVIAVYKRRTLLDEMEATIKIEMVQRGLSAEDVERVLQAKMGVSGAKSLANLFETISSSRKSNVSTQQAKPA